MPTTRSTASTGASSLAGDRTASRINKELQIDGTAALKGGKIDRKPCIVRKSGGASYEITTHGSWVRAGTKRSAATAGLPPALIATKRALRTRQPANPPISPAQPASQPQRSISKQTSKKRQLEAEEDNSPDEAFRKETLRQVKRVKVASYTQRAEDLEQLLSDLPTTRLPRSQYVVRHAQPDLASASGDSTGASQPVNLAPEAYDMTVREARTLLQATNRITAPVFVARAAPASFCDPEIDDRRPVEQILDYLPNPEETFSFHDKEAPRDEDTPNTHVTVAAMKDRFINQLGYQEFPMNFPELRFPMPAPELPGFIRHPSNNLLNDIVRNVQEIDNNHLCPPPCVHYGITADRCPTHYQTAEEVNAFRLGVQHWQGTIMMAEAGAYTPRHYDTLGLGTLICCYEGEIGFAYQTTTTTTPQAPRKGRQSPKWFYKVLRPGDAVYMPPGTYHMVFRQPYGNQTLATAVRVLRYCDVVEWLKILSAEFDTETRSEEPEWFARVVRALVMGTRHYIDAAKAHYNVQKFGGAQKVKEAEEQLAVIDEKLLKLLDSLADD